MKVLTEDMDKVVSLPKLPEKRMYEKTFGETGKKKRSVFFKTSTSSQGETLNEICFLKKKVQKHSEQKPRIARLAEPYCSNGFHASSVQEGCVCTQF